MPLELRHRFQDIADAHYNELWQYVSYLTGGSSDTEDLTHQAFLLAFDRLASGTDFTGDPGKWLRGAARNLVRAWWRQTRRLPSDLSDALEELADNCDDAFLLAVKAEGEAAVRHCLEQLPADDRQLICRRYEIGDRITRIADEFRMNVSSLRVRLFRIRQALKLCIESQLSGENA